VPARPRRWFLLGGADPGPGNQLVDIVDVAWLVVDGQGRGVVAAAQARHLEQLDVGIGGVAVSQGADPVVGSPQPAGQVVADVQRDLRRRLGAEVRIERDQPLDLVQRPAGVA
jgi:hypothetical protein